MSIQIGWITWETRVNIIKVTYEFEGVQTVEVVDERDTGPLTIFYMERFVIRQNNLASNGDGLTRRVIALERCPHQKPCEDWMPQLKDGKWEVRD
ncbi:MAG TPA: hypothetical protein VGP13_04105 [Candidatus Paceibacterota bacterium]|nr:hypothetical protein [Candidatus Paceibacterota bacterium]